MKSKNITGIILSRKDLNEADRLLSVFSFENGRIEVIARGSRKLKSKMAGHIEPFTIGKYQLVEGKTFDILTGAETINSHDKILNNIELYKNASYLCELTKLTIPEGEVEKKIFNLLKNALNIISGLKEGQTELLKRFFEYQILTEIGYKPNFINCKKCKKLITESNKYSGGFEGFYCKNCIGNGEQIHKNTFKMLRLFSSENLKNIIKIKTDGNVNNELKKVIYAYICNILPRLPKSEGF